eukprot:Hpha_TRINITY_DN16413_c0_g2::TRINITY_DN16413_c0_g2_i1::g.160468::m.160468
MLSVFVVMGDTKVDVEVPHNGTADDLCVEAAKMLSVRPRELTGPGFVLRPGDSTPLADTGVCQEMCLSAATCEITAEFDSQKHGDKVVYIQPKEFKSEYGPMLVKVNVNATRFEIELSNGGNQSVYAGIITDETVDLNDRLDCQRSEAVYLNDYGTKPKDDTPDAGPDPIHRLGVDLEKGIIQGLDPPHKKITDFGAGSLYIDAYAGAVVKLLSVRPW